MVGTAAAGSTIRVYTSVDCSGPPLGTVTAAELEAGITLSVTDDSLTRFRATATSSAGTPSACSSPLTYVEDSTSPQTQIDSGPPGQSGSPAASFSFSGTDTGGSGVASFQCRMDSTQAADWGSCTSPKSYSGLADGSHTFEVRAIDQAGNTDQTPASFTWTVDTTAPTTSIDSSPPALSNSAAASFNFSGSDTGGSGVASLPVSDRLDPGRRLGELHLAEGMLGPRRRLPHLRSPGDRPGRKHRRDPGELHLDRRHHRADGQHRLRAFRPDQRSDPDLHLQL